MSLLPDLFSADQFLLISAPGRIGINIYLFAFPNFLILSLQTLKLCNQPSSALQTIWMLRTVSTWTTDS